MEEESPVVAEERREHAEQKRLLNRDRYQELKEKALMRKSIER